MPREPSGDPARAELLRALARGPASAAELTAALRISQPTLSRAMRAASAEVLVAGRARATRYAARRPIGGVRTPVPVYEVRPVGERPRRLLDLHPVRPDGFWGGLDSAGAFHDDLPWFLQDLRPNGFLGRLLPRRHSDLDVPRDIRSWTADHVLRYATRFGWNLPGAFVLGDPAFDVFVAAAADPPDRVDADARALRYPELASDVLQLGPAGSSAAGEQPKFLVTRADDGLVPVIVKFSPPLHDEVAVRIGDLLVAEHVALETLAAFGVPAARSSLSWAGGRLFLEVERFDREGPAHRRGVVSLAAIDGEFVGSRLDRWSTTTEALLGQRRISPADHRRVRWLEMFGRLIANTDMHPGNLSFLLDGSDLAGVAPAYDMGPAMYAPTHGEIVRRDFAPAVPSPSDADVASEVWAAATAYWTALAARSDLSAGFRRIATVNASLVGSLERSIERLPGPG